MNQKDRAASQLPTDAAPHLEIQLFGRFLAKVNGEPVDERRWGRRSSKSLVKLLSIRQAHTLLREQIIDLLWPDQDADSAINNLNKAIHGARRALEPALAKGSQSRFILTPRNQVVLASPGALLVDADQFEQAANAAMREKDADAARRAVQMYRAPLLIEDIYEEWTIPRRESLRLVFRSVSIGAAEVLGRRGDHAGAIEIAHKLVGEDPADEFAHQLLMRFHAETGHPHQALKQFEHCRAALQALDSEPGPQTQALEQAIRLGTFAPMPAETAADANVLPASAASTPHITPVTYQTGIIRAARFAPTGDASLVAADWPDGSFDVHHVSGPTGRAVPLGLGEVELFAVSAAGDLAIGLQPRLLNTFNRRARLAVLPATGKDPIELADDVQCADWHPGQSLDDGLTEPASLARRLAIVRDVDGTSRLEFPIGTVLYESAGWFSHPRFSPDGTRIAFLDHPIPMDDAGRVVVLALDGSRSLPTVLAEGFLTLQGLAWHGEDVCFTGARKGLQRSLYRVDPAGRERIDYHGHGNLKVHDGHRDGRLLVSVERSPLSTFSRREGDPAEHDISWHEFTIPRDISADGSRLLVEEWLPGGKNSYAAYVRHIDGSDTRLIGEGVPVVWSPDERTVILRIPAQHTQLTLLDVENGTTCHLPNDPDRPLIHSEYVSCFPDGRRIAFEATEPSGGSRIYFQDLPDGLPVCFTPDEVGVQMLSNHAVSPDGKWILLRNADHRLCRYRTEDGRAHPIEGLHHDLFPTCWATDGQAIFLRRWGSMPMLIYRHVLGSGTTEEWLRLQPERHAGVTLISNVKLTPDGRSYAYGVTKHVSDLYTFQHD